MSLPLPRILLSASDRVNDTARAIARRPKLRLGITGLSRAGKTVFITSLVNQLMDGGLLPAFRLTQDRRLQDVRIREREDLVRFPYERNLRLIRDAQQWPPSTKRLTQLSLELFYTSSKLYQRSLGTSRLDLEIIDYPGEWLIDLTCYKKNYWYFSHLVQKRLNLALSLKSKEAQQLAKLCSQLNVEDAADPERVDLLTRSFAQFQAADRELLPHLPGLPPGRGLIPGELDGLPIISFCPDLSVEITPELLDSKMHRKLYAPGSIGALMQSRYNGYLKQVVGSFITQYLSRIDRQVVLIDLLPALEAGSSALEEVAASLNSILDHYQPGANFLDAMTGRRIKKVLFAANKADHLLEGDHMKVRGLINQLLRARMSDIEQRSAGISSLLISSVRATRSATIRHNGEQLPALTGYIRKDGKLTRKTLFSGDIPANPEQILSNSFIPELKFLQFLPPKPNKDASNQTLPHIRLDQALEFLIGDVVE